MNMIKTQKKTQVLRLSDEEIEEQEPKREPRKRGKVIDSDDESPPPREQPLKRGKAIVFDSDDE